MIKWLFPTLGTYFSCRISFYMKIEPLQINVTTWRPFNTANNSGDTELSLTLLLSKKFVPFIRGGYSCDIWMKIANNSIVITFNT